MLIVEEEGGERRREGRGGGRGEEEGGERRRVPDLVGDGPWSAQTERGLPFCLWPYAGTAPQTMREEEGGRGRREEEGGREGEERGGRRAIKHRCRLSDVISHR